MNNEMLALLDYLERDRKLERSVLAGVIEEAIEVASRKSDGYSDIKVTLNPKTGDISALAKLTVVDDVIDRGHEISIKSAQEHQENAAVGDVIELQVPTNELGRIAAQNARQGIFQRLKRVEKDQLREKFRDRVGELMHGEVLSFERSDVIMTFEGVEGVLRRNDRIKSEEYQVGDHLTVVLTGINEDRGPLLRVSRSHPKLVQCFFEREVSEIADGIVQIKAVAREAGFRSKIAVYSDAANIDPVGACVGVHGSRIKSIVRELNGEKIDVVHWNDDINIFIREALKPAELDQVDVDYDKKQLTVTVRQDQLSQAIGRSGQNAKLAGKLTGWRIEINKKEDGEVTFEEKMRQVASELADALQISEATAKLLVDNGYLSIDGIKAADDADLESIEGIDPALARAIIQAAE
ncbi:MAG: transcription termination factor NusA [Lentisphaeria bacterium]|nr:transcription termination factor NusA [Lentisphaeria bacterium]